MDELVTRVSQAANIDPATAQQAIAAILAFLRKDGPPEEVDRLLAAVPGADGSAPTAEPSAGGFGLGSMLGSAGGLMGLASELTALGLSMGDMQSVGRELFGYAREKVGDEAVGQIAGAIPGLAQFI